MKKCTKCHQEKPLDQFYNRKSSKDGHFYNCKACHKKYTIENKEKIKASRRRYYELHKDELNAKKCAYAKANRPQVNARMQIYKAKLNELAKIYHDENPGIAFSEWRRLRNE